VRQIVPSGSFFEVDADGCIVNPCATALVPKTLWPVVNAIIAEYDEVYGPELLAVYLRGSAPRGQYMPLVSDLDVVGVVRLEDDAYYQLWTDLGWDDAKAKIRARFLDAPSLDFALAFYNPTFPDLYHPGIFVLKTQALCVWGEDITKAWPAFKIDSSIAFQHRWLVQDWETWKGEWRGSQTTARKTAFLQSFAKTVLRAGFELVMEREGRYTVDLYPCWQAFSRHYPDQAHNMEAALLSYLNPTLPEHNHNTWMERLLPMLIEEAAKRLA
jgi:uncharacterized protein